MSAKREFVAVSEIPKAEKQLRVMQWNILARGLSAADDPSLKACDPSHLAWDNRLPRIIEEIKRQNPDILSVEELDQKDDLMAGLPGYQCLYAPNPDSPCLGLTPPSQYGPDGVAIIYK